jgi:hypothetical protein
MPDSDTNSRGATRTEVVLPTNWPEACAEFAQRHHGALIRVLTLPTATAESGDTGSAQQVAAGLPLAEVAAVAAVPLPNIDIRVTNDGRRTVQRVEQARALALEKASDGTPVGLRIDDADGVTTLVRLASEP